VTLARRRRASSAARHTRFYFRTVGAGVGAGGAHAGIAAAPTTHGIAAAGITAGVGITAFAGIAAARITHGIADAAIAEAATVATKQERVKKLSLQLLTIAQTKGACIKQLRH
jgi:hypothetical protein